MRARLRFLIPAVCAAAACAVPSANAGLLDPITNVVLPTCGATGQPFAGFGDYSAYYGFANNGFESGTTGWSLQRGAGVVRDNEPWFVNGPGRYALALPAGGSATSPSFCINLLDPASRLFARSAGANGSLQVQVIFHGLLGNITGILNAASLAPSDYGNWAPSQRINSLLALPLGTTSAQIKVTSTAKSGTWVVDDLFVDPLISRIG